MGPDTIVRICQFHVIQAIWVWDTDSGERGANIYISAALKYEILIYFRILQRCRSMDEWPATRDKFYAEVRKAINSQKNSAKSGKRNAKGNNALTQDKKDDQFKFVKDYFDKNWFTDRWLCTCTRGTGWCLAKH